MESSQYLRIWLYVPKHFSMHTHLPIDNWIYDTMTESESQKKTLYKSINRFVQTKA